MQDDQDVAAYIGLDWGDREHAVQLQPAAGGAVEQRTLEQRPEVLHAWVAQLRERFGGRPGGDRHRTTPGRRDPRADAVRVPRALPGQSQGAGPLSRSLPPQRGQRRPDGCRVTAWTCSANIATSSGPGTRIPSRRASSSCSASTGGNSSTFGAASRTGSPASSNSISRRPSTGSAPSTRGKRATFCGSGRPWLPSSGPAPPRCGGSISSTTAAGPP